MFDEHFSENKDQAPESGGGFDLVCDGRENFGLTSGPKIGHAIDQRDHINRRRNSIR